MSLPWSTSPASYSFGYLSDCISYPSLPFPLLQLPCCLSAMLNKSCFRAFGVFFLCSTENSLFQTTHMAVFLTELILYSNTTLFGPFSNAFTLFPYPALCFSIAMCPEGMTFICHPILYLYPLPHDFVISQSDTGFGYMTYFGQWNFSRYDAGRHLKKPALIST